MSKTGYAVFLAVILVIGGVLLWLNHTNGGTTTVSGQPRAAQYVVRFTEAGLQKSWPMLLKVSPAPPLGNPKAPWTVIEIGDFQCPNCGAAEPLVRASLIQSNGKAKLYFVNFPLTHLHPFALGAAEAAESAAAQGKFWQMYDLLYGKQDQLIESEIQYNARSIAGLDNKKLIADMTSKKYDTELKLQTKTLTDAKIDLVPTLLVRAPNGKITWYCGVAGSKTVPGIALYAAKFPWGGGLGEQAVAKELNAEAQAAANGPTSSDD